MLKYVCALFVAIAAVAVVAVACEDCWPIYDEEMSIKPSNWVTVGQYDPSFGDTVWTRTVVVNQHLYTTRWYVYHGDDAGKYTAPSCCPVGPHYITGDGNYILLYP